MLCYLKGYTCTGKNLLRLVKVTIRAILYKDNLTIHILRAGSDIGEIEFYFEVDDPDFQFYREKAFKINW